MQVQVRKWLNNSAVLAVLLGLVAAVGCSEAPDDRVARKQVPVREEGEPTASDSDSDDTEDAVADDGGVFCRNRGYADDPSPATPELPTPLRRVPAADKEHLVDIPAPRATPESFEEYRAAGR